ncbi:unnamed protein product, partial [Mucor fragilis]
MTNSLIYELKEQNFLAIFPKLEDKTSLAMHIISAGVAGTSSASITVKANNIALITPSTKRRIEETKGVDQVENSTDNSSDLDDLFPSVSNEQRSTLTKSRRIIFQAGYDYFTSDLPLQTVHRLNHMANQLVPSYNEPITKVPETRAVPMKAQ